MFESSEYQTPPSRRTKVLASLIAALALVAIAISIYLTWTSWQSETVAGCSSGEIVNCDQVLGSRWSRWLGVPVSLFGLLTYVGILSVCWPAAKRPFGYWGACLLSLSMLAAGAAIWFSAIQVGVLHSYCFYCLGIHICGLSIAVLTLLLLTTASQEVDYDQMRALLGVADDQSFSDQPVSVSHGDGFYILLAAAVASVGLTVLIGGQLLVAPPSFVEEVVVAEEPETIEENEQDLAFDEAHDVQVESEVANSENNLDELLQNSRQVSYEGLPQPIELSDYPMIGNQEAQHVFLEMIDYTCEHCRRLHPYIKSTLDRYDDQIAFVVYHAPLSSSCNPYVRRDQPGKRNACDYARLAISVWKLAPEEFPAFHDWLMESEEPPPIVEARQRAIRVAGQEVLIDETVRADFEKRVGEQCEVLHQLKVGLPLMVTQQGRIRGVPVDEQEWFAFLEQRFGVKPTNLEPSNQSSTGSPGDSQTGFLE